MSLSDTNSVPSRPSRFRDWLELGVGYGLILLVIWSPRHLARLLYWTPMLWVVVVSWLSYENRAAFGLRATNFLRSFWVVVVAILMAAVAVAVAIHVGTLHSPKGLALFFRSYIGYAIWSFVQQFLMVVFFLSRAMRLMPGRVAVLVTASIFALAHLPNPVLTPLTLIWGLAACMIFLEYRNLWTLGLAHAIFGICVAITFPSNVTHGMRVGMGYLRYRPHADLPMQPAVQAAAQRRNRDQRVSTPAWVTAEAPIRRS